MEAAHCFCSCSAQAFASTLLPNYLNHGGCPLFLFLFCSSICFYIIAQFTFPWRLSPVSVPVLLKYLHLHYCPIHSTMEAAPCFGSCSGQAFASTLLPNSLFHGGCPLFLFLFCSSICFFIIAQFTLPWRLPIVSVPVLLKHLHLHYCPIHSSMEAVHFSVLVLLKHLLLHYCPIHSSMEAAHCFCSCSAQAFASSLLPNSLFHGGCPLFLFLFCLSICIYIIAQFTQPWRLSIFLFLFCSSICFYIIAQFTLPWKLPIVSVPVLLKHLLLHYCPIHSSMEAAHCFCSCSA